MKTTQQLVRRACSHSSRRACGVPFLRRVADGALASGRAHAPLPALARSQNMRSNVQGAKPFGAARPSRRSLVSLGCEVSRDLAKKRSPPAPPPPCAPRHARLSCSLFVLCRSCRPRTPRRSCSTRTRAGGCRPASTRWPTPWPSPWARAVSSELLSRPCRRCAQAMGRSRERRAVHERDGDGLLDASTPGGLGGWLPASACAAGAAGHCASGTGISSLLARGGPAGVDRGRCGGRCGHNCGSQPTPRLARASWLQAATWCWSRSSACLKSSTTASPSRAPLTWPTPWRTPARSSSRRCVRLDKRQRDCMWCYLMATTM